VVREIRTAEPAPLLSGERQDSALARLLAHARTPLFHNGYALILSAGASSMLGIIYWALAARFYPRTDVGLNSAAISAMLLFSGMAQLNLVGALIRYLPRAGRATRRVVTFAYAANVLLALAIGLALIALQSVWSPVPGLLHGNPTFLLWFILATVVWGIFALQDFVLTGLRQAVWVPIENVVFAVLKIVLLIVLAGTVREQGIFLSWTLPTVLAVIAVNVLIYGRLIPRHMRATEADATPIVPRDVISYVAGNYAGYLFFLASTTLLPLMVDHERGAAATAYFYLAWVFAYSIQLIAQNMSASLTVEGSIDEQRLASYSYRVLIHLTRIVVPLVVVIVVAAPLILDVFGSAYSANGTPVLRLLALAAIPNLVNVLYIAIARVQRRTEAIVLVQGALCLLGLGLSYLLLRRSGIVGVGIGWLVSQTVIAAVLLLTQLRSLVLPARLGAARPG